LLLVLLVVATCFFCVMIATKLFQHVGANQIHLQRAF